MICLYPDLEIGGFALGFVSLCHQYSIENFYLKIVANSQYSSPFRSVNLEEEGIEI